MLSQPRHVLPLMVFFGVAIVGVRVTDIWDSVSSGKVFTTVQQVQAAGETKPAETKPTETKATETKAPEAKETETKKTGEAPAKEEATTDAKKEVSTPEGDLFKQLMGRREQLDKRSRELDEREALANVTEQRLDQKIKEMETLREQLQKMVGQAAGAQAEQLENLVKIYETMKPKEAAKIFETLEMPVLLGVVQKMKPARTAAVMAEMNPQKAKDITVALTQQDRLPQIK